MCTPVSKSCLACVQEKNEYVENIMSDLKALGFQHDGFSHTSDHFEAMLACARKLIEAGVLYADDTPVDQMREVCIWNIDICGKTGTVTPATPGRAASEAALSTNKVCSRVRLAWGEILSFSFL